MIKYDMLVYIGRFQPFHVAHQETINRAINMAKHVLVLIGSSNSPRTIKNPWTAEERKEMILSSVPKGKLIIGYVKDYIYDDNSWIQHVGEEVALAAEATNSKKIAIIGHDKDHSSFYLNYFPQWGFEPVPNFPAHGETIDSTKIRNLLFEKEFSFVPGVVGQLVWDIISNDISYETWFKDLYKEYVYVREYKKAWEHVPYPPTFTTVDGIVVQSGHILLIRRGQFPGNGLWALPGGFLDTSERLEDAVIRELIEETRLKVPEKVLKGSIKDTFVYDEPSRSTRGRTLTHAFYIKLDDALDLPRVKGGDDAAMAKWIPLYELEKMEPIMYEDHWHIIKHMLNRN